VIEFIDKFWVHKIINELIPDLVQFKLNRCINILLRLEHFTVYKHFYS